MTKLKFELNYGSGFSEKNPPRNSQKLKIQLVWVNQFPNATVSGIDFIWDGQNAKDLWAYKKAGLTGGVGISEGVGLRIYMKCGNTWQRFLDGYIDVGNTKTKWERDQVSAPTIETGKIDWFNNKIKSIDFRYLAKLPAGSAGRIIPATDYKKLPYCVVKISGAPLQEAMIALMELTVIKQAAETIRDIGSLGAKIGGDVVGITPPTTVMGTSTTIADLVEILLDVAYLTGCIITLLLQAKKIINSIWQFKKYKLCMREEDHWKRLCQYFGYQFSSTIYSSTSLHKDDTWLPKKSVIPNLAHPSGVFTRPYDEGIGFPNNPNVYGHYDGNCSDFVKTMCDKYNGACTIKLNQSTGVRTLYFEEKHHFNDQAVFTIQNTSADGYAANNPEPYTTNILELPWAYLLEFAIDNSDEGTLYRYYGTTCKKTVQQNVIQNIQYTSRGASVDVSLECATAKRKNYLSNIETALNNIINKIINMVGNNNLLLIDIFNNIQWIINMFSGQVPPPQVYSIPTNLLLNRLGWLELSDDKFSIPKSFTGIKDGAEWKLHSQSEQICAATQLMLAYHQKNLPTHGAQQDIYNGKIFHFCCENYNAILDKNVVTTPSGGLGNLTQLEWELETENAVADYGIYKTETINISEVTVSDGN